RVPGAQHPRKDSVEAAAGLSPRRPARVLQSRAPPRYESRAAADQGQSRKSIDPPSAAARRQMSQRAPGAGQTRALRARGARLGRARRAHGPKLSDTSKAFEADFVTPCTTRVSAWRRAAPWAAAEPVRGF